MCDPATLALLGVSATGATTAAGAGAVAATAGTAAVGTAAVGTATIGGALANLGTYISIGGALAQGIAGQRAARANVAAINQQMETEAQLTATEDHRRSAQMTSQIAQQRAELAARGLQLDSVTAVMLGQTAAAEMSFESQAVRSGGAARQAELSASERAARAEGVKSLLSGTKSAAGTLLKAAPGIWPGFMDRRIGAGVLK